ncbi:hypothetical protein [Parasitella parasitica]|uniref:Uncharacterized protein n=1 Tax=Parasitella parasitica TaxID=35722 RepID=A0A0B7MYI1_9FUNG|nr:hypothetical protein [Parasitella parasitica]
MVCIGPRKKEKKSSLLNPDDPASRGLKKGTSKLKTSKTNTSLAPSVASTTRKSPRPSLETNNNKKSTLPRPLSRNTLVSNGKIPSPVQRATSPKPPSSSRPNSMISVKSAASVASSNNTRLTSRTSSHASSTKRFPIAEMKEEVKDLKAKNEENMKLIANQKAELERLKQQLSQSSQVPAAAPEEQISETREEEAKLLKTKEEELLLREKEIEELRIRLEEQQLSVPVSPPPPAILIQSEEQGSKADILAQKEKLLEEKEAKLEEQKRMMEEKKPVIEEAALQLEALKTENLNAVNQLAAKEKELEELRAMISSRPEEEHKEEHKKEALLKIEELNTQLEAQKKAHEESLRLHEEALAEKDILLKEQKEALDALVGNHEDEVRKLKTLQTEKILALKQKHKQDKMDLEKQVEETRIEAENNPAAAVDLNEQLERMLHEFEQTEHTHAVQIQDLEQSHESELNHLQNDQKAQLNKLKRNQDITRDSWTTRFLPTDAVSWPKPDSANVSKLRPTFSLVESKSKTLLRVLGNMPAYQKPEPVLTPLDPKKVQVYYSSVSGNAVIKRNQERIQQLLKTNNIKFSLVDVASSETARRYAKKCNNNGRAQGRIKDFPQLFVGGEYRGQLEDVVTAIDDGLLDELLHPAEERQFTPEERAAIQKAEMNEEMAGPMRVLPPLDTLPTLKPTRSNVKPVRTLNDYEDEDEELFRELEKELGEGAINLDDL